MARANEESRRKSGVEGKKFGKRSATMPTKRNSRKGVQGGSSYDMTAHVLSRIPDHVVIVRRIFNEAADLGMGADLIARRLNREKVPTFGRSKGWHKSYVLKILGSRAVLGEFQPRTTRGEIQIEPKTDYFPAVIEPELFYRAQAAREKRRQGGGGRKGERISNLFYRYRALRRVRGSMGLVNRGKEEGGRLPQV